MKKNTTVIISMPKIGNLILSIKKNMLSKKGILTDMSNIIFSFLVYTYYKLQEMLILLVWTKLLAHKIFHIETLIMLAEP